MLIYWNFVINFAIFFIINWSVWVLSQLIIKGLFSLNVIALNSLLIKIAFFAVCDRANNLAFVLNIITVFCLFAFYIIGLLNSFIMYFCKFFLLMELSINDALLAQINDYTLFLLFFFIVLSFVVYVFPFAVSFYISSVADCFTLYAI